MPINLFNDPLASLKLGADNIIKGYVGNASVFPNLITIEFASISGLGYAYTLPPSQTGDPGALYPTTTFTISGTTNQRLTASSFAMTNLPASLSANVTGGNNTQTLTITITGNYPTAGVTPITSVVSGITDVTQYNAHFLLVGRGGNGAGSYISSGGGGGGVRTSFSPNGGGQPVDLQITILPNTSYTMTVGSTADSSIQLTGSSTLYTATGGNSGTGSTGNGQAGASAGNYGYGGGSAGFWGGGGGGGAGSSGGSVSSGGGGGGGPLINAITGSNVNYGSGGAGYSGNYGGTGSSTPSAYGKGGNSQNGTGQNGVIILRVPTTSLGSPSGQASINTVGSDTVITWTSSGSYTG